MFKVTTNIEDIPAACPGCSYANKDPSVMIMHWIREGVYKEIGKKGEIQPLPLTPHGDNNPVPVVKEISVQDIEIIPVKQRHKSTTRNISSYTSTIAPSWFIYAHGVLLAYCIFTTMLVVLVVWFVSIPMLFKPLMTGPMRFWLQAFDLWWNSPVVLPSVIAIPAVLFVKRRRVAHLGMFINRINVILMLSGIGVWVVWLNLWYK